MLLHLGNDYMIPTKDVVMIADIESTDSEITREFLKVAKEEGFIKNFAKGEPKSFVLTDETIYYSNISSKTLRKRMNYVNRLDRDH
ncbi:extracellular matrix regulator RemB [Sporohalobacter salinus]|uniref:extracellular matrix regulator RemB n=1 Tax=Sporohalobacter salinus TaxID=1494606 RepID=UPI00195F3324|nr:extracellular matrix/biofilm biosynthesis regulator RemA family protein [Sporohalobacter salinus]MBM7624296.1 ribosomal protein S8 [Sporohalobacter salinus]